MPRLKLTPWCWHALLEQQRCQRIERALKLWRDPGDLVESLQRCWSNGDVNTRWDAAAGVPGHDKQIQAASLPHSSHPD